MKGDLLETAWICHCGNRRTCVMVHVVNDETGREGMANTTAVLSPTEFYELIRSCTTRLEVQLMIENALKDARQHSSEPLATPDSAPLSAEKLRDAVAAEVERQVERAVREAANNAVQQTLQQKTNQEEQGHDGKGSTLAEQDFSQERQRQLEVAQRQREQILEAVRDVEYRVNALQRQVNELSHAHRNAHQLIARLCSAIEGAADCGPAASPPRCDEGPPHSRLFDALLQA
ncbi:hypothetical protein DQ04_07161040, partial [Trypanosoma grayi]|uniref:hypothetical protein n=1 Tax=Trypanosoma grayi TaxID=71804 RepID=UPI0004F42DB4